MTAVYAIFLDDYDADLPEGVYSTKELAEQALEIANDYAGEERYFIHECIPTDKLPRVHSYLYLSASIRHDGRIHSEYDSGVEDDLWFTDPPEVKWSWSPWNSGFTSNIKGTIAVSGTDVEQVRRVYNEKIADILANPDDYTTSRDG